MASSSLSKFNVIFYIFSVQNLAEAATNFVPDNTVSTNDESQQSLYSGLPQDMGNLTPYLIPYQRYIPSLNIKYVVSQPQNQAPIPVSSTEKTLLSSGNKLALDTSNYLTSQVVRPPQGNQANHPYLYTIAKVSPTTTSYTSTSGAAKINHESLTPKKYHYGYRVSNPHTGAEFGHSEVSDGLSARGYYHVLLPDGRLQNVKYWAGPSGYHATITYETQY